jgi:Kinesin motor domain
VMTEAKVKVSVVEIYNEQIRDLLPKKGSSSMNLVRLRDNAEGDTVSNERLKTVKSQEEALMYLRKACLNRAVGATHANEQSSRSHFIFTIHVTWRHAITKARYSGKLNLVDLAGSERLLKSYFDSRDPSLASGSS